jgi:DNA-binding CsgD family transcriptional regulator
VFQYDDMPACEDHPGSLVRRYRSHGINGPGVYPQCVPGHGMEPHLLAWPDPDAGDEGPAPLTLSPSEVAVLEDAALGLTVTETARKRHKGIETVKTQRRSILLKLGARNMAHAIATSLHEETRERQTA